MIKLILFDLDGTLIDSLEDLAEAVNHALGLRGLPLHSVSEYRRMVGHGVRNLVKQALDASICHTERSPFCHTERSERISSDQVSEALIDSALTDFKAYYQAHIDVHTRPYPGIPELLTELHARGIQLAVASNKFQEGTEYLIQRFFPGIRFVAILGNRPGAPLKPDPEIVQEVLRKADVQPADALLVGDSPTDMKTAANGGIESIAVTWGYRTAEDLAGHRQVNTVQELRAELL